MTDAAINRARSIRRQLTGAEQKLWYRLRDRRLGGHQFLRQMPVGPYVADFACREANLIVEADGSGHARVGHDDIRDQVLMSKGFAVLRFWNHEVVMQTDAVCETTLAAIDGRLEPHERYLKTARS